LRLADGAIWKRPASGTDENSAGFHLLAETGFLASATDPVDPMEKAFHELGQKIALQGTALRMVHAYGLRPDLLTMAQVWRQANAEAEFIVAAKGAPEAIAELCRLRPESVERVKREVDAMAGEGLRILGVARAMHPGEGLPRSQREFAFKFLGLVGLADPVRKSVPAAIADCRSAGIRVVMITGDYPTTARAIAGKAGLGVQDVFTGEDLEKLSAIELRERVRAATVFARIMPEQKLRIVNALKANGDIVCMTGDGVNDAPSLKAAHIGVAMGGRGTDVAREASSIVLLDDDFGSIVKAIRLGRRIYDNLRKAMGFIFAVHVPIAGLALLPLIFGLPILFGPVHIAFLEMVIDPVCSLVFEAETEEEAVMRRPPRAPDEPLFSRASIIWSLAQGALVLGLVGAIFVGAVARGMPDDEVRALAFFSLVLAILSLVFVNRSFSSSLVAAFRRPNIALAWVLTGVAAILTLSLVWAPLAGLLRFGPLHADDLTVTVGAGAAVLLVLEFLKPKFAKQMVS
jgi:Ca2+-transporting ATPase